MARTVKAVMNHPEVVKRNQEQVKEARRSSSRERNSGPSMGM